MKISTALVSAALCATSFAATATPNTATGSAVFVDQCYGFGWKFEDNSVVVARDQSSKNFARAYLEDNCGEGELSCNKWINCKFECGAIAIATDDVKTPPGVAFGKNKAAVKAKALAICAKNMQNFGFKSNQYDCNIAEVYCPQ